MDFHEYINQKKEIYNHLLDFIDSETYDIQEFQELIDFLKSHKIQEDRDELKSFLHLILNISKHHHRNPDFFNKIDNIINQFKNEIKQFFSNYDIFNLFKHNKKILLFLVQNKMVEFDEPIINYIYGKNNLKCRQFRLFFSPELKTVIDLEKKEVLENEISYISSSIFDNFEEKRQIGENDSYLCELIRNDSVQEFISWVTKNIISLKSTIEPSIYETNSFLIGKNVSLIEYAAFFGSIQIFRFLKMNNVNLDSSLWIYAIHGKNADIIHLLEDSHVNPTYNNYKECLKESIKCHHNEIANYIKNEFIDLEFEISQYEETFGDNIYDYGFHYYNYEYFPDNFDHRFIFYYSCLYDYYQIVNSLLKTKKFDIKETIVFIKNIYLMKLPIKYIDVI